MNPLTDIIPIQYRKYVYALYAVVALIVGVLNIVQVDTGRAAEVLVYVGAAIGATAASNTKVPQ